MKKTTERTVLYFVCLWDNNSPRSWLSIKPYLHGTELGQVQWRDQPVTVKIIVDKGVEIHKAVEKSPPDLYALLKSNLQKQVRRRKMGAVATANRMWELNQFELLRRLVVIAAEDAELSTEAVTVSWMMIAKSKGLVLNEKHRRWILGYVAALVAHPVCRWLELDAGYDKDLAPLNVIDSFHNDRELLTGILFRNAYGGLVQDPPMISQCIDWILQTDTPLSTLGVKPFKEKLPRLLISPAAIDHHIWNELVKELVVRHPVYNQEFVRTVIWNCSSGINHRVKKYCEKEWKECWGEIREDFTKLTRGYLSNILQKYGGLG